MCSSAWHGLLGAEDAVSACTGADQGLCRGTMGVPGQLHPSCSSPSAASPTHLSSTEDWKQFVISRKAPNICSVTAAFSAPAALRQSRVLDLQWRSQMEAGLLGQLSECSLPGCEQTTGLGFTEDARGKAVTHGVWRAEKCPHDLRVYLPEWCLP